MDSTTLSYPYYVFPSHILKIIREYSRPLTLPNWRTLHKFTNYRLFYCITNDNIPYRLLNIINTNMQTSEWYCMYAFVELWGPNYASIRFGIPVNKLVQINGMNQAINYYINLNQQIRRVCE
uniref:Uncharacterized protein n=1 Tax=viral metagenome TaxID=1070528 RepID=A0A6C0JPC4_9ZZZZ